MKTFLKHLFSIFILAVVFSSQADQLETEKGKLLLDNIREDISSTLSLVADIESEQDWTVYLSQTNGRLVRVGLVVEPSTRTVLSVAADSTAKSLGLLTGDIIQSVKLNGKDFSESLSSSEFEHGDELAVTILRNTKTITLKDRVKSSLVPSWQLYSSSTNSLGKTLKTANVEELSMNLQSEKSLQLLSKLEARINYTLSKIYHVESKESQKLDLYLSKVARVSTDLGVSLDQSFKVLSIKPDSNADRIGLQVGDVIRGYRFQENQAFNTSVPSLVLKPNASFTLQVQRKGNVLVLTGVAKPTVNPSWSMKVSKPSGDEGKACGVITVFFDPPFTKDIYKAQITEANGNLLPKLVRNDSLVLPAGRHEILIHANVPDNTSRSRSLGKLVEFMVVPDKRYFLGVKYDRSKRFSARGDSWEPYVWKVEDYECSLDD